MKGNIDVMQLFRNYEIYSKTLEERILHLCAYQGSINYEDVWGLTMRELETFEEKIAEKLKMMQKLGIGGMF